MSVFRQANRIRRGDKMTSVTEMGKLKTYSPEWFKAAFEDMPDMPENIKAAAMHICSVYVIVGQADPGYIANTIKYYLSQPDSL
jgi:hypothetical protein